MAYQGPTWTQQTPDRRGEFIAAGWQGITDSIKEVGGALSGLLKDKAAAADENDYLTASWQALPGRTPEDDDKFIASSLGAKRGMVTGAFSLLAKQQQQQQADREFGLREAHQKWTDSYHPPQFTKDPRGDNLPPLPYDENGNIQDLPPLPEDSTPSFQVPTMPDGTPAPAGVMFAGKKPMGTYPSQQGQPGGSLVSRVDPVTGKLAWFDGAGKPVDPDKLRDTEEIPGTARPGKLYPMPPMPGIVPGMKFETPGTPAERRLKPTPPPPPATLKTVNPGLHSGPNGTFYVKPDGRTYSLEGEGPARKWVEMPLPADGDPNILLPPGGGDPNSPSLYSQPPAAAAPKPVAKPW